MKPVSSIIILILFAQIGYAQTIDLSQKVERVYFEDLYTQNILAAYYDNNEWLDYLQKADFEALQQQLNSNPNIQHIRFDQYSDIESYGLWMYLLDKDEKSVFYNKKEKYQQALKQLVPQREWEYFSEAMEVFDLITTKGDVDALWGALLSTAQTEAQLQRFAQHWQNAAKTAKTQRDLKEIERLITYNQGEFWAAQNLLAKALPHYQKWYDFRKEQGKNLASAYLKLSNVYTRLGKHKESYELWKSYDALYQKSGATDQNGWHAAKHRAALNNLARYHNADKAIEDYEQTYLKPQKVYVENGSIWFNTVPYAWAVLNAKTIKDKINYMKQWGAAIDKYSKKNPFVQANGVVELLTYDYYEKDQINEEVQLLRIKYFEERYVANLAKAKSTNYSFSKYRAFKSWSLIVPYEGMIKFLIANERAAETAKWYKKWLEAAIKTADEEIIRTTCIKVFEGLGKEKKEELAKEFFVEYYCKRLSNTTKDSAWAKYNEWPYRWLAQKNADEQAQQWVELAKKHASPQLFAWVLEYSASYTNFHGSPEWASSYLAQRLVLVETHQQTELIHDTQIDIIWNAKQQKQYPLALNYTIKNYLFDQTHKLQSLYDPLSPFHTIVSACLTEAVITKKDKKNMKKQLKKLQKQLKKESEKHASLLEWIDKNIAYFDF